MKTPNRRQVLRGIGGVTLGLPALDIFQRRATAADAAEAEPTYAVFVVTCNGVVQTIGDNDPELFWPKNMGQLTAAGLQADAATRATAMLSRYANQMLLVRGVNQSFVRAKACLHTWGDNQALTAQPGSEDTGGPATSLAKGESIDNRIAREKNESGRGPLTLHAGNNAAGGKGYGSPGYVSYRGPLQPNAPDSSPWEAYTRMVGLGDSAPELQRLVATRRKSVNDLVRGQLKRLTTRGDLSAEDRRRLDAHFSSVRDLEVGMAATLPPATLAAMEAMSGKDAMQRVKAHLPENREAVVRLHMDLIAFAFASDVTRVATLKIGDNNDGFQHTFDGMQVPSFHMISHRVLSNGDPNAPPIPNAIELHGKIVRRLMDQFHYLADKLAASSSPKGSLLDRGYALWTNQIANGYHSPFNMPYIILGGANNRLKTGQYLDAKGVSHNRLLNALLAAADVKNSNGAPVDNFGDPSLTKGVLSEVLK